MKGNEYAGSKGTGAAVSRVASRATDSHPAECVGRGERARRRSREIPALATSSAGLANTLGYRDGERIPLDDLLWMVRRITRVVQAPVSVDFESGFAETPEHAAANCRRLLDAGVVGINLEDGTGDPARPLTEAALQVEKIRAIRAMAAAAGISFVINARTDIFLDAIGPEETRFDRAVERLLQYRQAGADCLFIPGVM